jgi:hypothetical protein
VILAALAMHEQKPAWESPARGRCVWHEIRPLLVEALRLGRQIDDRVVQFYLLDAFGCHAALSGRTGLAAWMASADRR